MCPKSGLHVYTTESGYYNYKWTVTSGGTIASGQGTYQIEVDWTSSGAQTVTVNYETVFGCAATTPASFEVTVLPLPGPAEPIAGDDMVCAGDKDVAYSVNPIPDVLDYIWVLPAGATIVEGENTNSIKVDFASDALSGPITVQGENHCGRGKVSPPLQVDVNPIPPAPTASVDEYFILHSSAHEGNQWYFNGEMIEGATGQTHQAEEEGNYWTVVTLEECASAESNHVEVIFTGLNENDGTVFSVYPMPNDGKFTVLITTKDEETFTILVYNAIGIKVYEKKDIRVDGKLKESIDLNDPPAGIYTVVFQGAKKLTVTKVLVTR
jgi:hypothetical protein